MIRVFASLLVIFGLSAGWAQVTFAAQPFEASAIRNFSDLQGMCAAPTATSFWCAQLDETLTLIPSKGNDYLFNSAGELVAAFTKQQRGQNLGGNYNVSNAQNLIPMNASVPGLAVLLDNAYVAPEVINSDWQRLDSVTYRGTFELLIGGLSVTREVLVRNTDHTVDVNLTAEPAAETDSLPDVIQLAVQGIARTENPVVKIGQSNSFSENPLAQPVASPSYISLQTSRRGVGNATVMRPAPLAEDISAIYLQNGLIAMQTPLQDGSETRLNTRTYLGANELVRFYQESLYELPGLFSPNILGRLSLGILWVLLQIHAFVGNWGLAIIVLTVLFRIAIWPLISTQTRSMYAMQRLQPKLQELQKKHKNDREKLTQETMKLYQQEKVNPAGGCLPIVAQMPLFIILWRVFANFEFNEGFLWIPDLGLADPFYILPALYIGVIFAQSYFMSQGNKQSLRQQILMNAIFIIFIINFPAGVTLYWVVSMLIQVLQYYLIRRSQAAPAPAT